MTTSKKKKAQNPKARRAKAIDTYYQGKHQRLLDRVDRLQSQQHNQLVQSVIHIADRHYQGNPPNQPLPLNAPEIKSQIDHAVSTYSLSLEQTITQATERAWTNANDKHDRLLLNVSPLLVRQNAPDTPTTRRLFSTHTQALRAFRERRERGLNLSDRVWQIAQHARNELEMAIDIALRDRTPSASIAPKVKQYLNQPDKLFRRVRDEHGQLHLSRAAKAYHPGQGVYRSSAKNARRLAVTEVNGAYRTAEHLRIEANPFVLGYEVRLSNNHTLNGKAFFDICDDLKGKYPKDFKFVGWHPHCRCHVVTINREDDDVYSDVVSILFGGEPNDNPPDLIDDLPDNFVSYLHRNTSKIEGWAKRGTLPYFLRDNQHRVQLLPDDKEPTKQKEARHKQRTPEQKQDIQKRWDERQLRINEAKIV